MIDLVKESLKSSKVKKILLLSLITHIVAAFTSRGHLHPDEHFQILEFLNYKWGGIAADQLPWEFEARMRPWSQVFLYYLLATPLKGLLSPFGIEFTIRLFSSLLAFLSFNLFSLRLTESSSHKNRILSLCFFNFIWFIPFVHARISSESVGTSFFLLGLLPLLNFKQRCLKSLASAGFLLGLSFQIRYHIGFFLVGLALWLLVFHAKEFKRYLALFGGFAVCTGLAVMVDHWGYGEWKFPAWEYVYQNIIEGKAKNYGVSPWWSYFKDIHRKAIPPYGLILIFSTILYWLKKPSSLFTWMSFPFFLVHCLTSHKEWRFLFPLIPFLPIFLLNGLQIVRVTFPKFVEHPMLHRLTTFLIFTNGVLLVASLLKPAHISHNFFRYTYELRQKGLNIDQLLTLPPNSPYWGHGLALEFFNFHHPKIHKIESIKDIPLVTKNIGDFWIFSSRAHQYRALLSLDQCQIYYTTYPRYVLKHLPEKWMKRSKMWALFKCTNLKSSS